MLPGWGNCRKRACARDWHYASFIMGRAKKMIHPTSVGRPRACPHSALECTLSLLHTHILPRNCWSILDSFHGKAVKAHSGRFTSCHLTVSCIFLSSGLCPAMLLPFLLIYQNPAFNPFPTSINTFQGASP